MSPVKRNSRSHSRNESGSRRATHVAKLVVIEPQRFYLFQKIGQATGNQEITPRRQLANEQAERRLLHHAQFK